MTTLPIPLFRTAGALAMAALLTAVTSIPALGQTSDAKLRYEQDRAKCMRGDSNQDRATCLQEAGAALDESKKGAPAAAGDGGLARNRLERCRTLPSPEREECVARMDEGTASGSAQQGGVLREVTSPAR